MREDTERFLETVLNAPSPSGAEQPAARVWRDYMTGVADQVYGDVHGNSFAVLNPDAPFKFMLAGHIDEIGLMVTHIDKEGFLSVAQVGGADPQILVGQRVRIATARGDVLGVIGRKAPHLTKRDERNKPAKIDGMWIDVGAKNKKDAEKIVAIGDCMVLDVGYQRLRGDRVIARGCDDKAGAFVAAEVIRRLARRKKSLKISVVSVATVQEEIGLRGATTSSYSIKPDAGIAIDVGFATDHPDSDPKMTGEVNLGAGPNLHRGPNINPVMAQALEKCAADNKIPIQITGLPSGTGTDANSMQLSRGGVAVGLVSIPNRYMHSPVEMISLKDLDNIVKLLTEFLAKHPATRDYRP